MDYQRKKLLVEKTVKGVSDARDLFADKKRVRPNEPGWYTSNELADFWEVAGSTARERIRDLFRFGKIKRWHFGRAYLYKLVKQEKTK